METNVEKTKKLMAMYEDLMVTCISASVDMDFLADLGTEEMGMIQQLFALWAVCKDYAISVAENADRNAALLTEMSKKIDKIEREVSKKD